MRDRDRYSLMDPLELIKREEVALQAVNRSEAWPVLKRKVVTLYDILGTGLGPESGVAELGRAYRKTANLPGVREAFGPVDRTDPIYEVRLDVVNALKTAQLILITESEYRQQYDNLLRARQGSSQPSVNPPVAPTRPPRRRRDRTQSAAAQNKPRYDRMRWQFERTRQQVDPQFSRAFDQEPGRDDPNEGSFEDVKSREPQPSSTSTFETSEPLSQPRETTYSGRFEEMKRTYTDQMRRATTELEALQIQDKALIAETNLYKDLLTQFELLARFHNPVEMNRTPEQYIRTDPETGNRYLVELVVDPSTKAKWILETNRETGEKIPIRPLETADGEKQFQMLAVEQAGRALLDLLTQRQNEIDLIRQESQRMIAESKQSDQKQIDDLNSRLSTLQIESARLTSELFVATTQIASSAKTQEDLLAAQSRIRELESQIQVFSIGVSSAGEQAGVIESLQQRLDAQERKVAELETARRDAAAAASARLFEAQQKNSAEMESSRRLVNQLTEEKRILTSTVESLQIVVRANESGVLEAMRKEREEAKRQIDEMRGRLTTEASAQKSALEAKVVSLESQISAMAQRLTEAQARVDEASGGNAPSLEEPETPRSGGNAPSSAEEVLKLKIELDRKETELISFRITEEELRQAVEREQKAKEAMLSRIAQLEASELLFKGALESAPAESKSLIEEITQLRSELGVVDASLADSASEGVSLSDRIVASTNSIRRLRQELKESQSPPQYTPPLDAIQALEDMDWNYVQMQSDYATGAVKKLESQIELLHLDMRLQKAIEKNYGFLVGFLQETIQRQKADYEQKLRNAFDRIAQLSTQIPKSKDFIEDEDIVLTSDSPSVLGFNDYASSAIIYAAFLVTSSA